MLITPVEVMEVKLPNYPFKYSFETRVAAALSNNPESTFPRPIKRKDVRVGDDVSFLWEDMGVERFTISRMTETGAFRYAVDARSVMFSLDDKYDSSHPLTLHSRKGECDAVTNHSPATQHDMGSGKSQGSGDMESDKPAIKSDVPVCRGDILIKPIPKGFKKVSLGGTVCIIPKADWKYTPKQPPENSPEVVVESEEIINGRKYKITEGLMTIVSEDRKDWMVCLPLDIRIKKHLEARGK